MRAGKNGHVDVSDAPAHDNPPAVKALIATVALMPLAWMTYGKLSSMDLPPVSQWLVPLTLGSAMGATGSAVTAKVLLGDYFHVEIHSGRIYIQWGAPSQGPLLQSGAVEVRPTGDTRGNGAFARQLIPKGTHVCDYEGELLGKRQYFERYPTGQSAYVMGVDHEWAIDASALVAHTSTFSAVHMNHSRMRPNVVRYMSRAQRRVSLFAARDIAPGEELVYNYGARYWQGRENLEVP